MNKEKIITNCESKMYFKLTEEEKMIVGEAIDNLDAAFSKINRDFPNLSQNEPMTHTIVIEDIILSEDKPVETPEIEVLFKNSARLNGREIEVPKVVG